jgi:hypothetical protein
MEKTRIVMHKFIGEDNNGNFTYEISFNKSLIHTSRMDAMCRGLDKFDKRRGFWFFVNYFIAFPISKLKYKWAKNFYRYTLNRF